MNEDIFHVENPVTKGRKPNPDSTSQRIISLLDVRSPLTLDQIQAGLKNKYNDKPKRSNLLSLAKTLYYRGKINRDENGVYSKIGDVA